MPCLHIFMNIVLTATQKQDGLTALSKIIARATSKPEDYVQVILQDGVAMLFAGSTEKTAFVDLHSIGSISRQKNKGTSADVTKYLSDNFGIPANRIYITFHNAEGENWGFDGDTFG